MGDIAAIASQFGEGFLRRPPVFGNAFAAALPGPVSGEALIMDVADLVVRPTRISSPELLVALVDGDFGGGLLVDNPDVDTRDDVRMLVAHAHGDIDASTPVFGWPQPRTTQDSGLSRTYVRGDLTGDGNPDHVVGAVIFDRLPDPVLLEEEGLLAVAASQRSFVVDTAIGDLNDDGAADLVIAHVTAAETLVVFGPIDTTAALDDAGRFGASAAPEVSTVSTAVGDLDGDGVDDLAIGDQWAEQRRGQVRVWLGPLQAGESTAEQADFVFTGEVQGGNAGRGLAIGDVNGDDQADLVIGAPHFGGQTPGLVYLLEGPLTPGEASAADATTIYRGEQPGSALGLHLVACNLTDSSRQDLVVGAPDVDDGDTPDAGAVYWIEP